jgi:mRNA interferase RelE/StbE
LPIEVRVNAQVRDYQRGLAPLLRRRLKQAIAGLALGHGDIRALGEDLSGFHRLRVGEHRVVYRHGEGTIECFYAAPRKIVYEYLAANLRKSLEER